VGEDRIEEGKGRLKEAVGAILGNNAMKREGKAQQRKGDAQERADIARILGCRLGTVKSSVHRGLATLRKELS
jgi:uncharacterized protein YjbJ (UPF0337 family)